MIAFGLVVRLQKKTNYQIYIEIAMYKDVLKRKKSFEIYYCILTNKNYI